MSGLSASLLAHLPTIIAQCRSVADATSLRHAFESFGILTGLRWFALDQLTDRRAQQALSISNLPHAWLEQRRAMLFAGEDPLAVAVSDGATSVLWSEMHGRESLTASQKAHLQVLSNDGAFQGLSLPIRIPGEHCAIVSFATDDASDICDERRAVSEVFGLHIFEAARRLHRSGERVGRSGRKELTARQRECLTLVAQGKSDWEAGRILGLSDQTVHAHIEVIRRRYGVRRRSQLIVHALFDGSLMFEDVL